MIILSHLFIAFLKIRRYEARHNGRRDECRGLLRIQPESVIITPLIFPIQFVIVFPIHSVMNRQKTTFVIALSGGSESQGWVSFSKRPGNTATCYTKPLDSLKNWNGHFFWVDTFACPASFSWNASTTVSKDPFPKSSQYNTEHYATFIAYSAPFHKYPEPFLCLVGINRYYTLDENTYPQFLLDNNEEIDLLAFICTADPTKVRIGERQRGEDEPKLLDTTVGRAVLLLPVAPARAQSELDASVDRLFDEEGSGNEEEHHDSADGGQGAGTLIVSEATEVVAEDVIPLRSRQRKQKTIVDADEPSHLAKKLRNDYGAPGRPSVAGKSRSTVKRLLVGVVLNANVRGEPVSTLPFVTSSVSATSEHSSYHSGANIAEAKVDSVVRSSVPIIATVVTATADVATTTKEAPAKEAPARPSLFVVGSSLAGGTDLVPGGFSDVSGSGFFFGGIRTVVDQEFDLQKVYVLQWSITNGSCLDDGRVCREMLDEFAPPKFFASICGIEHTNFLIPNSMWLIVEEKGDILLKTKGVKEIDSLNAQLLLKEAESAEAIHLRVEASRFGIVKKSLQDEVRELEASSAGLQEKVTAYEKFVDQLEEFQDDKIKEVNDKLEKLDADVIAMLALTKCLNSTEYLSALGAEIGKAVEKGMHEGLSADITHDIEGSTLTDIAAYNPSVEAHYLAALHHLKSVNFSYLRIENPQRCYLNADQLKVSKHHSPDQPSVIGALRNLTGTEGTSAGGTLAVIAILAGTSTALSVTFASTSVVRPISTDDYEIVHADDQMGGSAEDQIGGDNVDPFPNVDNVDLNLQYLAGKDKNDKKKQKQSKTDKKRKRQDKE
ncbi:hypothetical protein Tco_0878360 [Tanacetum coccineum]|uniref:Transposase (Putative), gypsy type n=1 Tax=Tanacetum coccineum TaxID=301880 RepID=A0ABQ5BZI3_9ASTR